MGWWFFVGADLFSNLSFFSSYHPAIDVNTWSLQARLEWHAPPVGAIQGWANTFSAVHRFLGLTVSKPLTTALAPELMWVQGKPSRSYSPFSTASKTWRSVAPANGGRPHNKM